MEIRLSATATPKANTALLQCALDKGGTIRVEGPGTYTVTGPLLLGNGTALIFGAGVTIQRGLQESATHPFLMNRGVLTGERNEDILVEGLHLVTGKNDLSHRSIYPGLRGHLSFLHVRNLVVRDYECLDLILLGYGIHICDFQDILLEKIHLAGDKDGIHLSDGCGFTIRDCILHTYDDGIALNAYDYSLSTAIYGSLREGLIENCTDLPHARFGGSFCRMLSGIWGEWKDGMEVQNSTTVVHEGRLYSACLPLPPVKPDTPLLSHVPPTHKAGISEAGGIQWRMIKEAPKENFATCENISFRDVRLKSGRPCIGLTLENNLWASSAPDGFPMPPPFRNISLDSIQTNPLQPCLIGGSAPATGIHISNSELQTHLFDLYHLPGRAQDYPVTRLTATGIHFTKPEFYLARTAPERQVSLQYACCSGPAGEAPLCSPTIRILSSDMTPRLA